MKFKLKDIIKEKNKALESVSRIEQLILKLNCEREKAVLKKSLDFKKEWYNKLLIMEKECLQ